MSLIGVRELRQQTSEVIRRVREEGAEYVVTYQGRPVAIILPLDTERAEAEMVQAGKKAIPGNREQYEQILQEIRDTWPADLATQGLLDALREEGVEVALPPQTTDTELRDAAQGYGEAMRTMLTLEEYIVRAAQGIAHQRGVPISKILSDLAQRVAPRQVNGETRHGVPLFPVQQGASVVTLELVNQLRDEIP